MSQRGNLCLEVVEIVSGFAGSSLQTTDDDEKRVSCRSGGLGSGIQALAVLCPAKSARIFMDYRSIWTTTVKSMGPQSSFLSQRRLATTYTVRDCRQESPLCAEWVVAANSSDKSMSKKPNIKMGEKWRFGLRYLYRSFPFVAKTSPQASCLTVR
jgi:hypothetical protein